MSSPGAVLNLATDRTPGSQVAFSSVADARGGIRKAKNVTLVLWTSP